MSVSRQQQGRSLTRVSCPVPGWRRRDGGVIRSDAIPLDSGLMIRRGGGARCGEPGSVHVPVSVLTAVSGNTVAPGNVYRDQVLYILREGDPSHALPRVCPWTGNGAHGGL